MSSTIGRVAMPAQIVQWYNRAQIDYANTYMALYASFNAWYRVYTQASNDREAINRLREHAGLWELFSQSPAAYQMVQRMIQLVECTQREPISYATPHWRGVVAHKQDWIGLVEYWYRVRCLVMHGAEVKPTYIYLAYETLNIFMGEVIQSLNGNTVYNTSQKRYN